MDVVDAHVGREAPLREDLIGDDSAVSPDLRDDGFAIERLRDGSSNGWIAERPIVGVEMQDHVVDAEGPEDLEPLILEPWQVVLRDAVDHDVEAAVLELEGLGGEVRDDPYVDVLVTRWDERGSVPQ